MCCGAVQQPVESLQYPLECGQSGVISCKICPSMVEVLLPGPCLPADVRRKIAEVISVSTDDVELYFLEGKRLVAVHDNRLGISVYHALLRLRGGKGGFRKQLEKKGRAFARSKRLRNATLNQDRERQINTTSGNLVTTNEQHARDVSVKICPKIIEDWLAMSRSFPWRSSCPSAVVDLLGQLPSCELLLVRRIGPTCFLLSKRDGIGKYRTSVGDPHSCSCSANDLCIHVIFVLCKVFFLPKENPLIWQRSLVAAEVEEILRSENQLKSTWRNAEDTPQDIVVPKPIEEGDVCPICFDELIGNAQLDYCQGGCGKYIHTRCFRHYMRHNSAGPLRCPYCRVLWTHNAKPHSKSCKACKKCICGPSYRCLFCPEYFLCTTCFHRGDAHSGHPFSLLGGREIAERTRTEATSLPTVDSQQPARVPDNLRPLMYREIEPDDYEALLQLDDQNNKRKLSIEEFATLHRENWSAGLLTDECNICLDSFDVTSSCVWLTCGHYFHVSCAQKWLTEHTAECPIDHVPVIVTRSSPLSETNSPFIAFNEVNVNRARRFNHRLLQRRRINLPNTSVDPRNVARASRRTVGSVNDNNVSVSALELHAVPLGIGPRRLRNNDQFFYGTL